MSTSPSLNLRCLALLLIALHHSHASNCIVPNTIVEFSPAKGFCEQPYFFNFLPKSPETVLIDNICSTFFPLPDDPNTFMQYTSTVYCDGSNSVQSFILSQRAKGQYISASPMITFRYLFTGYAGCDTYVALRCTEFGEPMPPTVAGITNNCSPLALSCLRKVEEVIRNAGLPDQEFYVLPNKLPNRCVTQVACTLPPNPFYNQLGPTVGLAY